MSKPYHVYILASRSRTLYIGMTSDLFARTWQHREKASEGFTNQYNIHRLVYFEETSDARVAVERERQLKSWRREKKVNLIETENPTWADLSEGWTV
jgi:putative endonuclease